MNLPGSLARRQGVGVATDMGGPCALQPHLVPHSGYPLGGNQGRSSSDFQFLLDGCLLSMAMCVPSRNSPYATYPGYLESIHILSSLPGQAAQPEMCEAAFPSPSLKAVVRFRR